MKKRAAVHIFGARVRYWRFRGFCACPQGRNPSLQESAALRELVKSYVDEAQLLFLLSNHACIRFICISSLEAILSNHAVI